MKYCYVLKKLPPIARRMISLANEVIDEWRGMGIYSLTLRQMYYQFVARDWFPDDRTWVEIDGKWRRSESGTKNAEPNYKWLGDVISDGRLCGLIDWEAIEDRTRRLAGLQHFNDGGDALRKLSDWYWIDLWANQSYRPEVWIEKDAVANVVEGVCQENDVPFLSCRGYTSLSEMWRASERLKGYLNEGKTPFIIHFGDHDPSGVDMSRDIVDRLQDTFMADCEFKRVALNMDQIEEINPPPNPAKITDSRCKAYVRKYGEHSWELDALKPPHFREIIERELNAIRNDKQWATDVVNRDRVKDDLTKLAGKPWSDIRKLLTTKKKATKKTPKRKKK